MDSSKLVGDWSEVLNPIFSSPWFPRVVQFIANERQQFTVYPEAEDTFRAFKECPLSKVKVVILGQDPYYNGQADGLAFSTKDSKCPASLRNIYKELEDDLGVVRTSYDLTDWANQGVLLLNTALTVVAGSPESHLHEWVTFTEYVIESVSNLKRDTVFVLWGSKAQFYMKNIDPFENWVLKSSHPSPLSAHRGFLGSKPFSRINYLLKQSNLEEITWGKFKDTKQLSLLP